MQKKAICVGNSAYTIAAPLQFALNDAEAVKEKLSDLGFSVEIKKDINTDGFDEIINSIDSLVNASDVFLFYYAGHAFENDGINYLMPVDLDVKKEGNYRKRYSMNLNEFVEHLHHFPDVIKIFIIDACRKDVRDDIRGEEFERFASIPIPSNTLLAFGTSSGSAAVEGTFGSHGNFTSKLLEYISLPRTPIEIMFKRVREDLANATHSKQISWEHSSLIKELYLNPGVLMSGYNYSPDVMKDGTYVAENEKIRDIIVKFKRYEFNAQNAAVNDFKSLANIEISPDDLFVVGRNIYQSAVGNGTQASYEAQNFVRDLDLSDFPVENRSHILCGMAYEIYFNSHDELRERFKTGRYEDVLQLLEKNDYFHVNNYISRVLRSVPQREIYIPSEKGHLLQFVVEFDGLYGGQENPRYGISAVTRGETVLSISTVSSEEQKEHACAENIARKLKALIAKSIVAPQDDVSVEICFKNGESLAEQRFILPSYLKIERQ